MSLKIRKLLSVVFFAVLLVAVGAGYQAQASPLVQLKLSLAPAATGFNGQCMSFFAEEVKRITNGEVEVQVFAGGSLVSDGDFLDAVMAGAVDMGHFSVGYITPVMKEFSPFELFGVYSPNHFPRFAEEVKPLAENVFAKYGVKFLTTYNNDRNVIVATEKVGKPIAVPTDMHGMVVRTSGAWGARFVQAWGGGPIVMGLGDVAAALQRGTIDAVITGWVIVGPFKLYESAPYVTITPFNENFIGLVMNLDKFNSLTPFQQAGIEEAALNMRNFSDELQKKMFDEFIQQVEAFGGTVHYMTNEEKLLFDVHRDRLMEEIKDVCGPEGLNFIEFFKDFQ